MYSYEVTFRSRFAEGAASAAVFTLRSQPLLSVLSAFVPSQSGSSATMAAPCPLADRIAFFSVVMDPDLARYSFPLVLMHFYCLVNTPELVGKWQLCASKLNNRAFPITVAPTDFDVAGYIDAWNHLLPFIRLMGTPFYFVEQDLTKNLGNLKTHLETAEKANVDNCDAMMHGLFQWEWARTKSIDDCYSEGPLRIVQRLNRALHFVELLIESMEKDAACDLTAEAKVAYEKTMSATHSWIVRTAVGVALYAIPDAKTFLERINVKHPQERQVLVDLYSSLRNVRSHLQVYFTEKKITHFA